MPEFSIAAMDRLLRRVGNERVSEDAALELGTVLESIGEDIAKEAIRKAEQEGVATITDEHIREAVKEL